MRGRRGGAQGRNVFFEIFVPSDHDMQHNPHMFLADDVIESNPESVQMSSN